MSGYIDREGRLQLSRLPLRVVRSRADGEVWVWHFAGRCVAKGFRLWPLRSPRTLD